MIYRSSPGNIGFDTKDDFDEINKICKKFKKLSKGNKELYENMLLNYFESLPDNNNIE